MIHVSLHFATEQTATFHNRVGWMDIGYETLAEHATYKAKLFVAGSGELPTIQIAKYPRWSATVWDLVLRVITKGLYGDEAFKLDIPWERKGAFIDHLYVRVEHVGDGVDGRRSDIASATVVMSKTRCNYVATINDDCCGPRVSEKFRHTPLVLQHWDLLARGIAHCLTGQALVPPRPVLYVPGGVKLPDGKEYVALGRLADPARIGFARWLERIGTKPMPHECSADGLVDGGLYAKFLQKAI